MSLDMLALIDFLHLKAFLLFVGQALCSASLLQRKSIVLTLMMSHASIVALRISLARDRALIIDEHALERSSRSSIRHHHVLRIVDHLRVVDST